MWFPLQTRRVKNVQWHYSKWTVCCLLYFNSGLFLMHTTGILPFPSINCLSSLNNYIIFCMCLHAHNFTDLFSCFSKLRKNKWLSSYSLNPQSYNNLPLLSQFIFVPGFTPSWVKNPASGLVQFHPINRCPTLQFIKIHLKGVLSLKRIGSTCEFGISKCAHGAFHSYIQIVDKYIEQKWP